MRTTWKRTAVGILVAGVAGGASLGWMGDEAPNTVPLNNYPPDPILRMEQLLPPPVLERQDSSVKLDWAGPPVVKVNRPAEYTLTVKNAGKQAIQKVVVQVRCPKETTILETTPAAKMVEGTHLWDIGTLEVNAEKTIQLSLKQATKGELGCQAWVTFTGGAAMKAQVKEPKLAVVVRAPQSVILGDKIPVEFTATNTGDWPAEQVELSLKPSAQGPVQLAALKPGESTSGKAEFLATVGGEQTYEATVIGADGLKATAKAVVLVKVPKLEVAMTGPADRMLGKKAQYTITVRNCGDVALTDVVVREHVPAGFRALAGNGGVVSPAGDHLSWPVGELAAGASRQVTFEGTPNQPGTLTHSVEATGSRGTAASTDCRTTVEGIPALRMELVDSVDPIEKGQDTTYEIKVTNTGSKGDADLRLVCVVPPQMKFKGATGPVTHAVNDKGEVTFDLIRELAPKTEAVVKVTVVGSAIGDARFKATLTSKHLNTPVMKEESTRIYGE